MADDPLSPYPLLAGWDRYTGYGRINANDAVNEVAAGNIPPEADINSPDWYSQVNGVVDVDLYANARWTDNYSYALHVGPGIEPTSWTLLDVTSTLNSDPSLSSASLVNNHSVSWDTTGLPEGFYTLLLTVQDDLGNVSRDRMGVWVQAPDPQAQPGFPQTLEASIESTAGGALVDLDGDNTLEVIVSTGDGKVHAIRHDGTELTGFPVSTAPITGLPGSASPAFNGNPADGEVNHQRLLGRRRRHRRKHRCRPDAGDLRRRLRWQALLLERRRHVAARLPGRDR